MIQPPAPADHEPYRAGYRSGFQDGFDEATERARRDRDQGEEGADRDGRKGDGDGKAGEDEKSGAEGKSGKADDADGKDQGADPGNDAKEGKDAKKGQDGQRDAAEGDGKPPLYKRPLLVAAVLVVLLVLIVVAIVFWRHSSHHAKTDDAFVDGRTTQVAALAAGRVTKLYVTDNQLVKAGDPLLEIDPRDTDARTLQARAQLATAEGQVDQAEAEVATQRASVAEADANTRQGEAEATKAEQDARRFRVVDPDAVPRQQADAAEAAARSARAKVDAARMTARAARAQVEAALARLRAARSNVAAARAQVAAAELQGSYTHVVAPIDGRVTRRSVELGNVVANGQALLALVGEPLWVTANFKETQLTNMQSGQAVEIVVDAYPDVAFRGHVDSIQRATGGYFSTLPAENATGNYVKVVQRVPVKIVFDDDAYRRYAIGPGMSVRPDVTLP